MVILVKVSTKSWELQIDTILDGFDLTKFYSDPIFADPTFLPTPYARLSDICRTK